VGDSFYRTAGRVSPVMIGAEEGKECSVKFVEEGDRRSHFSGGVLFMPKGRVFRLLKGNGCREG